MIPNPLNLAEEGELLQAAGFEIVLERRRVPDLYLPTGRLVVCDPLHAPETEPFAVTVPTGRFEVNVIVAKLREETKPAYVVIEFSPERPARWEIAHLSGEEETSWAGERPGAPIESNVIALMDDRTASLLLNVVEEDEDEFEKIIRRAMRRNRRAGARVELAEVPLGDGNVLAFDADLGTYVTYLGFDTEGAVTTAVLDFEVLDYQFTPFGLRY